jgi:hypothetical protein
MEKESDGEGKEIEKGNRWRKGKDGESKSRRGKGEGERK